MNNYSGMQLHNYMKSMSICSMHANIISGQLKSQFQLLGNIVTEPRNELLRINYVHLWRCGERHAS